MTQLKSSPKQRLPSSILQNSAGKYSMQPFAQAPLIDNRAAWVLQRTSQGKVLDIGCIDERKPQNIANSLHAQLCKRNPQVIGADSDRTAIAIAQQHGFSILYGNAETDSFAGPYDVIFAGELIEHLNNPGQFLHNMRKQLNSNGRLILTTPNPFAMQQTLKILKYAKPQVHQAHRFWFTPETLQVLLQQHGFSIDEFVWLQAPRGIIRRRAAHWRRYWAAGFAVSCR